MSKIMHSRLIYSAKEQFIRIINRRINDAEELLGHVLFSDEEVEAYRKALRSIKDDLEHLL